MARLLVVEDDDAIGEPLVRALAREGHEVAHAGPGDAALERLADGTTDLVVLDLGLPGIDGVEVCRRARAAHPRLLVLMLTARSAELDEVLGLDAGADDYVTKPFSLSVLTARVRALLRRDERRRRGAREVAGVRRRPRRAAGVARRARARALAEGVRPARAARRARRRGRAARRDHDEVWDENWWGSTKTLDVHVGWLRRKLGDPPLLTTVRGVGFRFERE